MGITADRAPRSRIDPGLSSQELGISPEGPFVRFSHLRHCHPMRYLLLRPYHGTGEPFMLRPRGIGMYSYPSGAGEP